GPTDRRCRAGGRHDQAGRPLRRRPSRSRGVRRAAGRRVVGPHPGRPGPALLGPAADPATGGRRPAGTRGAPRDVTVRADAGDRRAGRGGGARGSAPGAGHRGRVDAVPASAPSGTPLARSDGPLPL
ncbi:MAG: hypothetical protein AVDCRST_MAG60-1379, partial [uncultured Nocardioides sp.]